MVPCTTVCRDGSGYSGGGGYGSGGFSAGDYAADSSLVILDDVNFHEVSAALRSDDCCCGASAAGKGSS